MNDIKNGDSNAEREITITQTADNRDVWYAVTNDPVADRRLRKIGAQLVGERRNAAGDATMREYELTGGMVLLRRQRKKKTLTDAQRQNLRERLARSRKQSRTGVPDPKQGMLAGASGK